MNRLAETNVWPNVSGRCPSGRSGAVPAEPISVVSGLRPPAAIAFAEQHQIDPDEAYRDAVYAEIEDALVLLGWGAGAALLLVVGVLYFGGAL